MGSGGLGDLFSGEGDFMISVFIGAIEAQSRELTC